MKSILHEPYEQRGMFVLKRAFDKHAEETVCDKRVQRILAPVCIMIAQGRFDEQQPNPNQKEKRS